MIGHVAVQVEIGGILGCELDYFAKDCLLLVQVEALLLLDVDRSRSPVCLGLL